MEISNEIFIESISVCILLLQGHNSKSITNTSYAFQLTLIDHFTKVIFASVKLL